MTSKPEDIEYTIETKDGPICGYINKSEIRTTYIFKSIPYAKPPVGSLRFLPPSPIPPWKEVLDCTKDASLPVCPSVKKEIIGSEDCLYVEVFTPNLKPKTPMPVMFWIGSFSFAFFTDNIFNPNLVNDQDVVFVKCGFRLGPFGFLSINDYMAPGNCGLKDLVMALKWVQRNISVFGGDPNNVTIFGCNTGGAIVHFMMLSPMATGLFHKAIIKSASALNNWSLAKNPCQPVMELAKRLGITTTSKMEIIEQLRSIPATQIMTAFKAMLVERHTGPNHDVIDAIFKPCIEIDLEGQPAFITKSPLLIMKSGNFNKVPLVIGSNNIESATLQLINKDYADFEKINENVCLLVPKSLAAEDKLSVNIGHQLLNFYLGGEELREDTRTQYMQLISDYYFSYYVNKTVRLHSQVAPEYPIYYFIVNYPGEWSMHPHGLISLDPVGAYTEIPLMFGIKMPDICKDCRDAQTTKKRAFKLWTNFAKTGDPTPDENDPLLEIKWDPVESQDKLNYLSVGSELTKGRNPFQARMKFWDQLHMEHKFLRALVYFNDIGVSW